MFHRRTWRLRRYARRYMLPSGEMPRTFPAQSSPLTGTSSKVESNIWASAPAATALGAKHQNSDRPKSARSAVPYRKNRDTEAQVFWVAKHGIRRTGIFSNGLWDSDLEPWMLAAFIKRMNNLSSRVKEEPAKGKKTAADKRLRLKSRPARSREIGPSAASEPGFK